LSFADVEDGLPLVSAPLGMHLRTATGGAQDVLQGGEHPARPTCAAVPPDGNVPGRPRESFLDCPGVRHIKIPVTALDRALPWYERVFGFGVEDHDALAAWAAHLDELGIEHSPLVEATMGRLLVFNDPDGLEIHLYTWARHGIDHSARPGYGRPAETSE
jgi:hypothetical protein